MRRCALVFLLLLCVLGMKAQEDDEYRMEVGAGVGLVNYLGDFNSSLVGCLQPMAMLVAKYRMNPHSSWAFHLGYGQLKGNSTDERTWFSEGLQAQPVSFSHGLIDGGVRFEYNFWAYGTGREYRGAKPLAPFIAMGIGVCHASAHPDVVAFNMPLGFGLKYKVAPRLNLTAEWMMYFSGSDKLDGVTDPYGIKSSGIFKNTDCYSVLGFSLTYDLLAKCKTCNNDRD